VSRTGTVLSVCVSDRKGTPKRAVASARLIAGHGIEGDAHAGSWHRQISLLAAEQVERMRATAGVVEPGAFGENLRVSGIDLGSLAVGQRLRVGRNGVLQITQRGKECKARCRIYDEVGDCIMPREGLFARVRRGGDIGPGALVTVDPDFDRLRWAVVTLSDRSAAGGRADASGQIVCDLLGGVLGTPPLACTLLPDEKEAIAAELVRLSDVEVCDLVVTTGGTGLSPRDVTPDATLTVIDREIPGMAEAMRASGLAHTPRAMLSRAIAGQRGQTIIVNLSGSPAAVREQLAVLLPVLPHAVETASGIPTSCARVNTSADGP
jgi:molybdopterin adenylyltransferase